MHHLSKLLALDTHASRLECVRKNDFLIYQPKHKIYAVNTQKNHLNETPTNVEIDG